MLRYVIAFIVGGLAFMLVQPILASIALILLLGLILMLILTMLLPGGWMIFFGFRAVTGFLGRYVAPLFILLFAGLLAALIMVAAGPEAGLGFGFIIGGLAGVFILSRISSKGAARPVQPIKQSSRRGWPAPSAPHPTQQISLDGRPPKGWSIPVVVGSGFLGRSMGVMPESFREGVVVLGEAAIPATRVLVKGAVDAGMRVVIIGNPYIAPDVRETKLISLGKTSFNIISTGVADGFGKRVWAETIAVPLVVAAGLDTVEGGMVVRFLQKFAGSKMMPDDVDKVVAEYGPTSSARLKDALSILSTYFGEGFPTPDKLFAGGWRVLVLDTSKLSQSLQLFTTMYLLYEAPSLFPDCVVVFDSAELGLPEQSILPYDARHVWLRTFKAVERLKTGGFIMVASTGLIAPELLDLADTYVITRGLAHLRRPLQERMGVDVNLQAIPVGQAYVFTRVSRDGGAHLFGGRLIDVRYADIQRLEAEAEREATLLREEMLGPFRDTILYAEFADMAETCYHALRTVKTLATPTPERVLAGIEGDGEKALKQLLEKQYLMLDPAGVLGLTTLGEQALRDWMSRARKTQTEPPVGAEERGERPVTVQAGLQAFRDAPKPFNMSEPSRLVLRAREALMAGDALQAVGIAYKAAVRSLKEVTGLPKGHLTDLAEKAVEKGILKLDEDEVRRLYAANIEAKRLSKQAADGVSPSGEELKKMRDAAELLISLAERVIAFAESLPGGDEVG